KQAVVDDPAYFAQHAWRFRTLPIPYIETLFQGWLLAGKQHISLPWKPLLRFCLAVVQKRSYTSRGKEASLHYRAEWQEVCKETAELLEQACRDTLVALPFELRSQIWEILVLLCNDLHPTPEDEQPFLDDDMDRSTLTQTTIRGKALFAVQAF